MYGRVQTRLPLPAPAANRWCTSRALPLSPRPKALRAVETKPTGRTRGGVDRRNSVAFPRRVTCGIDSVANQEPLRACVRTYALVVYSDEVSWPCRRGDPNLADPISQSQSQSQ